MDSKINVVEDPRVVNFTDLNPDLYVVGKIEVYKNVDPIPSVDIKQTRRISLVDSPFLFGK